MTLENSLEKVTGRRRKKGSNLPRSVSEEGSTSAWAADLRKALEESEEAEQRLSYGLRATSERGRRLSGAYYTPADVARFFWNEFFETGGINNPCAADSFVASHRFIEPAAGSGVLIHSLLLKLAELKVNPSTILAIDLTAFDIDSKALGFIRSRMQILSRQWGRPFSNMRFIGGDFLKTPLGATAKPHFFFGNPPYVPNAKGTSKWKNLFADFMEVSLDAMGSSGRLRFILPLSLAFGRDYEDLRAKMKEHSRMITLSNFDNIPDTLFKFGKPKNTNSNKWNSQRCSILTLAPARKTRIQSTKLITWSRYERKKILSRPPEYHDVTPYRFDGQIPRPENKLVLKYIDKSTKGKRLGDLLSKDGPHWLLVGAVSRNYIGIRELRGTGVHNLALRNRDDFHRALLIVCSDLFFGYWRTVGDGFHVTKKTIFEFPVSDGLAGAVDALLPQARRIWTDRRQCLKTKLNSTKLIESYDFSARIPSLLETLLPGSPDEPSPSVPILFDGNPGQKPSGTGTKRLDGRRPGP